MRDRCGEALILCGYAGGGVRLRRSDGGFTLVSGQQCNHDFSKNAANRWRKRRKFPCERPHAIIGIRTAPSKDEANTHGVKKGILFDDESLMARHGTEPNRLIATAAGLVAFISPGMQHQVE